MKKKGLLIGLFLSLIGFGSLFAVSETQTKGMGLGGQSWAVENQLPYIFVNPAAMGKFGPMIYGETGGGVTNSKGGAIIGFGAFNLGVFIGQTTNTEHTNLYTSVSPATTALAGLIPVATMAPTSVFSGSGLANQNATLIGQFTLGEMLLGVQASYARKSSESKRDDVIAVTNESLSKADSSLNLAVGAVLPLGGFILDASVAYRTTDVANKYSYKTATNTYNTELKNDGMGDIIIDAQGIIPMNNSKLHIMAGFDLLNASSKATFNATGAAGTLATGSDNDARTGYQIRAGISDEMNFSDKIMGFAGIGFSYMSMTSKNTGVSISGGVPSALNVITNDATRMHLPIFIGMEAMLSDVWQARFGAGADALNMVPGNKTNTLGTTSNLTLNNSSWAAPGPTLSVGVSAVVNNFNFDWQLDTALLTTGPFNAPSWASSFAASYKFGEPGKTAIKKNL